MDEIQGTVWPGWETVGILGRGSFGAVYEIRRTLPDGAVEEAALKVITIPQNDSDIEELYQDGYDSESITQRYNAYLGEIVHEYSLMKELKGNTNVVYCDDLTYNRHPDGIGWDVFIKMELLTPLTKGLPRDIPEEAAVKLGKDMCNALVLCKERGIVHRDIKPQNIFISRDGAYKLGDFGIAKTTEHTTSGTKIGTYKYMAPEVYFSQPYGSAADIYSLGLVLYWMLNERRTPFLPLPPQMPNSTTEDEARRRRFEGEMLPPPAHGSEALKRIVLKACAYDQRDRYHTAAEMLADLNALGASPAYAAEDATMRIPRRDVDPEKTIFMDASATVRGTSAFFEPRQPAQQPQSGYQERAYGQPYHSQNHQEPGGQSYQQPGYQQPVYQQSGHREASAPPAYQRPIYQQENTVPPQQDPSLPRAVPAGQYRTAPAETAQPVPAPAPQPVSAPAEPVRKKKSRLPGLLAGVAAFAVMFFAGRALAPRLAGNTDEVGGTEETETTTRRTASEETNSESTHQWTPSVNTPVSAEPSTDFIEQIAVGNGFTVGGDMNGYLLFTGRSPLFMPPSTYLGEIVANDLGVFMLMPDGTVSGGGLEKDPDWKNVVRLRAGYDKVVGIMEDGTYRIATFTSDGSYDDQKGLYFGVSDAACGMEHLLVVTVGGSVYTEGGSYNGENLTGDWKDITAIAAGPYMSVGLKSDGTVVYAGPRTSNGYEIDVSQWKDVSSIAVGAGFIAANTVDGKVLFTGDDTWNIRLEATSWEHVLELAAADDHLVARTWDNTLLAAGDNSCDQCDLSWMYDAYAGSEPRESFPGSTDSPASTVSAPDTEPDWGKDITCVDAGLNVTVAGKRNGWSLKAGKDFEFGEEPIPGQAQGIYDVGANGWGNIALLEDGTVVDGDGEVLWTDIAGISAGVYHFVGVRKDGTCVAEGSTIKGYTVDDGANEACWDVSGWRDIVGVAGGYNHTVGLKSDGTVVAVGSNNWNQCDVSDWRDIRHVAAGVAMTVGLKSDGTVVYTGAGSYNGYDIDVSGWKNIRYIAAGRFVIGVKEDGTVLFTGDDTYGIKGEVAKWTNIAYVAASADHVVAVTWFGEVLTAGNNENGQCDISGWDYQWAD